MKAPFVCYADFECILKPVQEVENEDVTTGIIDPAEKKKEFAYQLHEPASYAYKIVSIDPDYKFELKIHRGLDSAEHLLDSLKADAKKIYTDYIKKKKPMPELTTEQQEQFDNAIDCHICGEKFKEGDKKIQDHCHVLGHYRGAAHNGCNLNYKIDPRRWKLPVFFHNLRGYDGHLIRKALKSSHGNVRVIPNNMENFMAFSVGQLQFLDSFQFTNQGLDDLIKTLDTDDFKYTHEAYPDNEQFYLLKKKGIFPYDFFDDISKLHSTEPMEFPTRETFFKKLADKECIMKEYLHAKSV